MISHFAFARPLQKLSHCITNEWISIGRICPFWPLRQAVKPSEWNTHCLGLGRQQFPALGRKRVITIKPTSAHQQKAWKGKEHSLSNTHSVTNASPTLSLSISHNLMSRQYGVPIVNQGSGIHSDEVTCRLHRAVEWLILDLNQPTCLIPGFVLLNTMLTSNVCALPTPWGLARTA